MSHSIDQWVNKVAHLLRDVGAKDQGHSQIETVGLEPAFAQYSIDRPRVLIREAAGTGSAYLDLPEEWIAEYSTLLGVEYPARQDPPSDLDSQSWRFVRSTADVDVEQLLLDRSPAAAQFVRLRFTAPWPYPTSDADGDPTSAVAFEAVSALAASFCLVSMAAETSKGRMASLPTNYVDGTERSRSLLEAASRYEGVYDRFMGLKPSNADSGAAAPAGGPAYGSFDLDPSRDSLFHGGRR